LHSRVERSRVEVLAAPFAESFRREDSSGGFHSPNRFRLPPFPNGAGRGNNASSPTSAHAGLFPAAQTQTRADATGERLVAQPIEFGEGGVRFSWRTAHQNGRRSGRGLSRQPGSWSEGGVTRRPFIMGLPELAPPKLIFGVRGARPSARSVVYPEDLPVKKLEY